MQKVNTECMETRHPRVTTVEKSAVDNCHFFLLSPLVLQ